MYVRVGDITINEDFIGYVKLEERHAYKVSDWIIKIRCNNDNYYSDEIIISFPSEKEARKAYEELVNILMKIGR